MRPRYRRFRALLACCIILSALASLPWLAPPPVAAGTAYTIVDLGSLRPDNSGRSRADGINEGGQIVGNADFTANADVHAFLREPNGTMRDLGTGYPQNKGLALAFAVNSAGTVAGISQNMPEREHAIVWRRDGNGAYSAHLLDSLTGDDLSGAGARDINDLGWVVGSGDAPRSSSHGALWQIAEDGTITTIDLGTLRNVDGALSFANALNDAGTIVGSADTAQGYTATRWVIDASGNPTILDLGKVIENSSSSANDINDLGLIVGQQTTQGSFSTRATLWRIEAENEVSSLQLPDLLGSEFVVSIAEAINNHGLIVGKSSSVLRPADFYESTHAVAWRIGPGDTAGIIDLNSLIPSTLGWELVTATDINDAGQIVGTGRRNGEDRAFLLNPVEGNILAISLRNTLSGGLDAQALGAVATTPTPAPGPYTTGAIVKLTAQSKPAGIFTGWTVDGEFRGWAATLTLTMDGDHSVEASFGPRTKFTDVPPNEPAREAIEQLAARGIVFGYGYAGCYPLPAYPCFGPGDPVRRAQLPAMLVHALGWQDEPQSTEPFSDLGNIDAELWRAISILAEKGVVKGYGDGRFGPGDEVSRAQAISMITRAMVAGGYWEPVTVDDPAIYPNIPADAPHRLDILTYAARVGTVPYDPPAGNWPEWLLPGSRAWAAQALWQALDSTFGP